MGHEERKRSATAAGLGMVGSFWAMLSLDDEYAAMVLQVWDERMADHDNWSPPDATRPPAHAKKAARLIREALEILSGKASK